MTRKQFDKAVHVAGAKAARLTLDQRLVRQEDVFQTFTESLDTLHNGTFDVSVGDLRAAAKAWLLKKPKRKVKADAVETPAMAYLLG
jgi:hypothetical protein